MRQAKQIEELLGDLEEIEDILNDKADINDNGFPNKAMELLSTIQRSMSMLQEYAKICRVFNEIT